MTNAEQTNLKELFSSSILNVPQYQRAYSWDERHIEDLLNDIESLHESLLKDVVSESDNFHYFGTVVLREQDEVSVGDETFTKYDIIDGQ
jgi:uncharacterized protein with ParB-like and HNH nuclease domain